MPLKTYLPDGDIDLTAIAPPRSEESLAREVFSVLQVEEQNRISLFDIKDVQYIHAEVMLQFYELFNFNLPIKMFTGFLG